MAQFQIALPASFEFPYLQKTVDWSGAYNSSCASSSSSSPP
eukprot:CAMPEP_0171185460 /NCGR_PEP_ID=MMETSP0790-20130122/16312_1 /TAXON_ID=2925 /ORGANISM="Alexandrium catenella, Strain OF101" /LENGTH=40 /DNA_ID= /DNA_START= /DNA_END= /DNA_ORIENTATION=